MAPKDNSLVLCMVFLMLHFSRTWVGLLILEDENGLSILSEFREEMDKNRVCVAFEQIIPMFILINFSEDSITHQQIIKSSTNEIITYGDSEFLFILLINLGRFLMTGKVWIMNSQCYFIISRRYFLLD
jgi:vomeronasal 2 receptor